MAGEVVRYHNDLNQIYLGKLNGGELNLLFSLIAKVKDHGTTELTFTAEELKSNLPKNYTSHEFSNLIYSLRKKFFKVDFTVLLDVPGRPDLEEERTINLFRRLSIFKDRGTKEVDHVIIQTDEFFQYLVNNLKIGNWTRFELEELFQIRGSYAKNLFRLLKQYRHTGQMIMSWQEFSEQMGIPESYTQDLVNRKILRPAVSELSEERTVEGRTRPTFRKLDFRKLTSPGSGRKITAIRFTFEPEERALPKSPAKGKRTATAQKPCPYAEGTELWYAWHHIDPSEQERQ